MIYLNTLMPLLISKAGVPVEPEFEWNIQDLSWDNDGTRTVGCELRDLSKLWGVSNQVRVS